MAQAARCWAVVSIAGGSVDEYAELAKRLRHEDGISAIEVNISCPNVESRGEVFACEARSASGVIHAVRRNTNSRMPVLAKLSPDVTDIVRGIARACVNAGADGVSVINTTLGMVIDTTTMRPALAGVTGGLSSRRSDPIAVRCVADQAGATGSAGFSEWVELPLVWTPCSFCSQARECGQRRDLGIQ